MSRHIEEPWWFTVEYNNIRVWYIFTQHTDHNNWYILFLLYLLLEIGQRPTQCNLYSYSYSLSPLSLVFVYLFVHPPLCLRVVSLSLWHSFVFACVPPTHPLHLFFFFVYSFREKWERESACVFSSFTCYLRCAWESGIQCIFWYAIHRRWLHFTWRRAPRDFMLSRRVSFNTHDQSLCCFRFFQRYFAV